MRIIASMFALAAAMPAVGSAPITVVELTRELAQELGFEIIIKLEGDMTLVNFVGPLELGNRCTVFSTGNYVLGPDGKEVAVYLTELREGAAERPKFIAYIANDSPNTLGVYMDYLCPEGKESESRRYNITSIRKWDS